MIGVLLNWCPERRCFSISGEDGTSGFSARAVQGREKRYRPHANLASGSAIAGSRGVTLGVAGQPMLFSISRGFGFALAFPLMPLAASPPWDVLGSRTIVTPFVNAGLFSSRLAPNGDVLLAGSSC